jgi:multisubunit Na+/H+ antiporter MnhG subunit
MYLERCSLPEKKDEIGVHVLAIFQSTRHFGECLKNMVSHTVILRFFILITNLVSRHANMPSKNRRLVQLEGEKKKLPKYVHQFHLFFLAMNNFFLFICIFRNAA